MFFVVVFIQSVPLLIDKQSALENEHIEQTMLKEGKLCGLAGFFSGVENFAAREKFWREELKTHTGDVSRDRLYGIGCVRLADIQVRRARHFETPIPKEAERLYNEALKVENNLGGKLYEVVGAAESLADLYQAQGRLAECETLLKQKMASLTRRENSRRMMEIVTSLVSLYVDQKRYQDAVVILTNEFRERELLGFPKYGEPWNLYELARVYYSMGDYVQTVSTCEEAIRLYGYGITNSPLRSYLAEALHKLGRVDEAEVQYKLDLQLNRQRTMWNGQKSIPIPDTKNGADSDLFSLGEIYIEQERFAEAEPLLHEALNICLQKLNDKMPDWQRKSELEWTKKVQAGVIKLYRLQGRKKEAGATSASLQ